MAATMSTTETVKTEKRKKKSSKGALSKLMMLVLIIGMTVLLEAGFLFVLFGMLPTIIAFYADTTDERLGATTIGCCNLSGVLPYVLTLHGASNSWTMLTQYLSDPMIYLHMYGMAACGYVLIRICPTLYRWGMRAINTSLAFQVQQQQENLVREWGEGIRSEGEQGAGKHALVTVR
jgi:hypothetical protein